MAASGRSKPDQRQSEGMLGLVGLFGRRLPRSRRKADAGCERDDRPIASITEPLVFINSRPLRRRNLSNCDSLCAHAANPLDHVTLTAGAAALAVANTPWVPFCPKASSP